MFVCVYVREWSTCGTPLTSHGIPLSPQGIILIRYFTLFS